MRRVVAGCIKGFLFDARSRRAIDETLADWEHEERQAINRGRRALAALQGVLSVARVISISLLRESVDFGWCRGSARRWGVVAALVGLLAVAQACFMAPVFGVEVFALVLPMAPMTLMAILPPTLFLIFAWRPVGRALPTAGAACFVAFALLILAGWLVPLSSGVVNQLLFGSFGPIPGGEIRRPVPSDSISSIAAVLHVMSWGFLGAATVTFAAKLARRSPLWNRWWLAGVPLIYAAFIPTLQLAIGTSFISFRTAQDAIETPGQALALWITAAILMILGVAYGRGEAQIPNRSSVQD
jgi:hypothetical protein